MPSERPEPGEPGPGWTPVEDPGHPRGTLLIVLLYGLLFIVGWVALWAGQFLPRGAPHP